jgi:inner membrane protein
MDSITHITLGACIGEIILGKKLGKKALLWGAFAQSLPDVDTIFSSFYSVDKSFLVHRGITHSILFALIAGVLLALLALKIHRHRNISLALFIFFFCFQLVLHDLLDTCNSYGTCLLEPFSHHRFSINLLYVADPLFTIGFIIAALFLTFKNNINPNRLKWAWVAIAYSIVYLCFAGINKAIIDHRAAIAFSKQKINPESYFSIPAPLTNMLWYVVAAADSGYYTAYSSVWDDTGRSIVYEKHLKNVVLLNHLANTALINNLKAFSENDYIVSQSGNDVYFNILRFEQIQGWAKPNAPFVFSYSLTTTTNDGLFLQKRRMQDLNLSNLKYYFKRIAGQINF